MECAYVRALMQLADDTLYHAFTFLPDNKIGVVMLVCKRFKAIAARLFEGRTHDQWVRERWARAYTFFPSIQCYCLNQQLNRLSSYVTINECSTAGPYTVHVYASHSLRRLYSQATNTGYWLHGVYGLAGVDIFVELWKNHVIYIVGTHVHAGEWLTTPWYEALRRPLLSYEEAAAIALDVCTHTQPR